MFLQCEIINGVAVPRGWTTDSEAAKTHDFITGDISVNAPDLSPNIGCYTGAQRDGSTDGVYEVKWYLHIDTQGNVKGTVPYMKHGVVLDVPAKKSDYVTGGIALTNEQRKSELVYNGTIEDGSTDGTCV